MKRIYLIAFLLMAVLTCNGCCFLAGAGMENAKKERRAREDALHDKIVGGMNKVAGYSEREEK